MALTQTMMRVRSSTKQRLSEIAKPRGWKIAEAAERAAEALAEKVGGDGAGAQGAVAPKHLRQPKRKSRVA